jgi:hypothetical protein
MNIYAGNPASETSEDTLSQVFSAFGQVKSVSIVRDGATGESKTVEISAGQAYRMMAAMTSLSTTQKLRRRAMRPSMKARRSNSRSDKAKKAHVRPT